MNKSDRANRNAIVDALASLRVRLLGLVFLALIPAMGLILYTASEQRQRAANQVQDNSLRLARVAAANQEQLVEGTRYLLIALAQLPAVRYQDKVACTQLLANLLAQYPPYANFGAVDRNGNIFCMGLPQNVPVNIADRSYFQAAIETRSFTVGEFQVSRANAMLVITFGYPVLDDTGQPNGIVFAGLNLQRQSQFVAEEGLPDGATVTLMDRNGTILVHDPAPENWVGRSMPDAELVTRILTRHEGVTDGVDADGTPRLYAFVPVQTLSGSDLHMVIGIPTQVAFADAERELARNLTVLCIVGLLAFAAAWFGGNWFILDRINLLLQATQRLSGGNLKTRAGDTGGGELGQLAGAFDEMAAALERRDAEQRAAQEQIRRQSIRTQALANIANRLNAQLDLGELLNAVCAETSHALGTPVTSLKLYDASADALTHAAGSGLPADYGERTRPVRREVFDRYTAQGEPLILGREAPAPDWPDAPLYAEMNVHTAIVLRLQHEGQLIGSLSVFAFEPRVFMSEELILLKGIAAEAALAIANARLYSALQQQERARARLLRQVITAQEDERIRIARELHDETGQSLSALILGLDVAHMILHEDVEKADAHLHDIQEIAEGLLQNTRRLVADLRPSLLDDLGLVPATAWYGEQRLNPLGIELHLKEEGLEMRLPRPMETALFRIVQEAFTNIVRHARATEVSVTWTRRNGTVTLEVADNGVGFNPPALRANDLERKGLGLRGMQERVEILGGQFYLQATPGLGTRIVVTAPVSSSDESQRQDDAR